MPVSVLIVDDHSGFRRRARRLLEAEGFDVVGEAGNGRHGVEAARALSPDLVLLDVNLPDTDGFAVAEELARDDPAPAVVITSTRDAADVADRVRACGARGFVPKGELSGAALAALV
ncbi:MAG TPA: response regulator transcription factor [Solirubrobacteraceae bacterium]|nr:response regulator transcription factor [Solirubrobacteraceae bacterium]